MSKPSAVRHINEKRLVEALFRGGPMSRADLARALGLTRATAGSLVSVLMAEGMIVEGAKGKAPIPARTGRPGDNVQLNPHHAVFLCADIGVRQLTVIALAFNATVLLRHTQPLSVPNPKPKQVVRQLSSIIGKVMNKVKAEKMVRGLAVTIPGLLNHNGDVLRAPILGWTNVKFLAMLKSQFSEFREIQVENDANAAAFAELYREKKGTLGDAVYLFLDVGVGGGVFSKGKLVTGHHGYAGELGHMLVGEKGYGPVLTLRGSLESYIGREAILARYKHHLGLQRDLEALIKAIRADEKAARATFEDCVYHLARGLAILTTVLNPEKFVFGGQVSSFFAQNPQLIKDKIGENLLPNHPVPDLIFSSLGSDGPAIGAACIMHHAYVAMDRAHAFDAPG